MNIIVEITDLIRLLATYYSTVGFLFSLHPDVCSPVISFAVSLAAAVLSYLLRNNKLLRFVPMTLLMLLLFPGISLMKILAVLPVVLFFLMRKDSSSYSMVRNTFTWLLGGFTAICLITMIYIGGKNYELTHQAIPFFILAVICSIFQMRLLRNNALSELGKNHVIINAVFMIIATASVLIISSPMVTDTLISVLKLIYNYLIAPIIMALMYVLMIIPYSVMFIYRLIKPDGSAGFTIPDFTSNMTNMIPKIDVSYENNELFSIIGKSILSILFIIIIVFTIKHLTERVRHAEVNTTDLIREPITVSRKPSRLTDNRTGNEIRDIYRKYLGLCTRNNLTITADMTSEDISRVTENIIHNDDSRKLRSIWLPEKYSAESDRNNIPLARKLYKNIKTAFKKSGKQ